MSKRPPMTAEQMKCGMKRAFESERIAQVRADESTAECRLWTYRCPHCKKFHLTSKKQRRRGAGRSSQSHAPMRQAPKGQAK